MMMKIRGKSFWTCGNCEAQDADMKAVVDSVNLMKKGQEEQKTELRAIKKGQEEQRAERVKQREEREKVIEGLKVVEAVAKKLERIEEKQEIHEQRLSSHDDAIVKNTRKGEEGERRIKELEDRMEKLEKTEKTGEETSETRQFNAVVQEVREIERREKNIVVFNVAEPTEEEEEARNKADSEKISEILKELSCDDISPTRVVRIGKAGRHPKQLLVILRSVEECDKVMKKCREGGKLKDDNFITRDHMFKQRQEARLFRVEKEKEERNELSSQPGTVRGGARGRGRPRGGGRGRGGRGGRGADSASRKRRNSDETENPTDVDDESKRRRTGGGGGGGAAAVAEAGTAMDKTPDHLNVPKPSSDHLPTPKPSAGSELGAVGGAEEESF